MTKIGTFFSLESMINLWIFFLPWNQWENLTFLGLESMIKLALFLTLESMIKFGTFYLAWDQWKYTKLFFIGSLP